MTDVLDSGRVRVLGYVALAVLAGIWGACERDRGMGRADWWPTYWWTSLALLLAMAVARAESFGAVLAEVGRERARSGGWYDTRRTLQVIAVASLAALWFVGVAVAVWRVPPRRRRYLPHAIGVSALVMFAAIRIVSLHHVDTLLYRRDVSGVRVVSIVELALLMVTAVAALAFARFTHPARGGTVADALVADPVGRNDHGGPS